MQCQVIGDLEIMAMEVLPPSGLGPITMAPVIDSGKPYVKYFAIGNLPDDTLKIFISQPMRGLSDEEVLSTREKVFGFMKDSIYKSNIGIKEVKLIDNWIHENIPGDINNTPREAPWMLGESIMRMAAANLVIFIEGWEEARGCCIEREVCAKYDIPCIQFNISDFAKLGKLGQKSTGAVLFQDM